MSVFYGPCPFLRCLDTDIHAHAACLDCGAVNHGNAYCRTCVQTWDISDEGRAALLSAIASQEGSA